MFTYLCASQSPETYLQGRIPSAFLAILSPTAVRKLGVQQELNKC